MPVCSYESHREFAGRAYDVELYDIGTSGISVKVHPTSKDGSEALPHFTRVFSPQELDAAQVHRTLGGYIMLVESLELVEDTYFTGEDAVSYGMNELQAYRLASTLVGMKMPPPLVSKYSASAYLTRVPVGLSTWNQPTSPDEHQRLVDVLTKGLAELCREKPAGLSAVSWLGNWLLDNNPSQPRVQTE